MRLFGNLYSILSTWGSRVTTFPSPYVVPKAQVSRYLASLFKTPIMQKIATDPNSPVQHLCERIAQGPLFTFSPPLFSADPAAETNFTAWWRLLALRTKDDSHPFVEDMYLLHECFHLAYMPYFPDDFDFVEWRDKMLMNEQQASFYSEAWIYHIHPELRQEFPSQKIWADDFTYKQFQGDVFPEFLMLSKNPTPSPDQARAAGFDMANDLWCKEYWQVAKHVENHMTRFHHACNNGGNEDAIIREHLDFIEKHSELLSRLANSYNKKWRMIER